MTIQEKKQYLADVCCKFWITLRKDSDHKIQVARMRLRCNSWLCPKCRKNRARRFSKAVKSYFQGERVSILTLTTDHQQNIYESYKNIKKNWNLLRTHLTKKIGKIRYVCVLEPQGKSGYPHLHVLVNKYIPPALLNTFVTMSGFGRIWDIKEVSDDGAFYYVRKYLRKEWKHEAALQCIIDLKLRRCSGSRGFSISTHSVDKWSVVDFNLDGDRAAEYVKAVMQSRYPFYWEVVKYDNFDDWESYSLEYYIENSHCDPDTFRDAIRDNFLRLYYHGDLHQVW